MLSRLTAVIVVVVLATATFALVSTSDESGPTGSSPSGDEVGADPASGPISFVLDDTYAPRQKVKVKIENDGGRAYLYQGFYAACFLSYFDSSGREFDIPPGTHCDLLGERPIKPGQTRTLFTWKLDECLKDRWGCLKSRPLPPDTYLLRGKFNATGGGQPARAQATFRIVGSADAVLPGGLECPGGFEDFVGATYDLGQNPPGVPTPRGALDRFLSDHGSDLTAKAFERTQRESALGNAASFSYDRDGLKLAEIGVVQLEQGWLVEGYQYCRSGLS